jgi:hypothetical protein
MHSAAVGVIMKALGSAVTFLLAAGNRQSLLGILPAYVAGAYHCLGKEVDPYTIDTPCILYDALTGAAMSLAAALSQHVWAQQPT